MHDIVENGDDRLKKYTCRVSIYHQTFSYDSKKMPYYLAGHPQSLTPYNFKTSQENC